MLSKYRATLGLFAITSVGSWIFALAYLFNNPPGSVPFCILAGIYTLFTAMYAKGFDWVRHVFALLLVLSTGFGIQEPFLSQQFSPAVLVVPMYILILADLPGLIGSALILLTILLVRSGGTGTYALPGNLIVIFAGVGALVILRLIAETAQRKADQAAEQARAEAARVEQQAAELATANATMEDQIEQQRKLLELVAALETPAVILADDITLAPVIGHMDDRRLELLTNRLLEDVHSKRTRLIILDITGVAMIDTSVALSFLKMVHAVKLLGCEVVITGISAEIASSIVSLGIDLSSVKTERTPQSAIAKYSGLMSATSLWQSTN